MQDITDKPTKMALKGFELLSNSISNCSVIIPLVALKEKQPSWPDSCKIAVRGDFITNLTCLGYSMILKSNPGEKSRENGERMTNFKLMYFQH